MDEKSVGARISELRANKGMTQLQLAEALGVSDKSVSKWEVGGCYPDITNIPVLADVLGVSIVYLLGHTGKTQLIVGGCFYRKDAIKQVNDDYLSRGWRVVSSTLVGEDEPVFMFVLEK